MWPGTEEAGFEVVDVVPGGPAAQAALRVGDRILAVDGRYGVSKEPSVIVWLPPDSIARTSNG